jgi:hypothetical protein
MHYHIIGTDHGLQKASSTDTGLKKILQNAIAQYAPVLIAEEVDANEDVRTFGRELIGDNKWLSIDMTDDERKRAGIFDELKKTPDKEIGDNGFYRVNGYLKRAEGIREDFWIDKIISRCSKSRIMAGTIIITCGFNHLNFLAKKLLLRNPEDKITKDSYIPFDLAERYGVFTLYP